MHIVGQTVCLTYQMPHKRRSDEGVGDGGERQPDDDDDFEPLELHELRYHADCDGGAEPTTWDRVGQPSERSGMPL